MSRSRPIPRSRVPRARLRCCTRPRWRILGSSTAWDARRSPLACDAHDVSIDVGDFLLLLFFFFFCCSGAVVFGVWRERSCGHYCGWMVRLLLWECTRKCAGWTSKRKQSSWKSVGNQKERISFYKTAGWPLANINVTSLWGISDAKGISNSPPNGIIPRHKSEYRLSVVVP